MLKSINSSLSEAKEIRAAGDERIHLFAEFTLDLARGCLLSAGEPVHLRPQAYEVLKYLAENKGRLIGKDKLIEAVWRGRAVTDDALVQCLIEVRHALGAQGKVYVRNVRGRGYIFDPGVVEDGTTASTGSEERHAGIVTDHEHGTRTAFRGKFEGDQRKALVNDFTGFEERSAFASLGDSVTVEKTPVVNVRQLISSIERHKRAALVLTLALVAGIALATRGGT